MASTDTAIERSFTHTCSTAHRIEHKWTIDNYSSFYALNPDSTMPKYTCIYSTWFESSKDKRIQFRIQLYPRGNSEENKDFLSVYLEMNFKEAVKTTIRYRFSIINERNEKFNSIESFEMHTKTRSRGWAKYCEQKMLLDKSKGFTTNDQLNMLCEIEIYSEPSIVSESKVAVVDAKSSCLSDIYGNLLASGEQSDVTFVVDGVLLKAHKAILVANSIVFKAMFHHDAKEKEEGSIQINDMTLPVAKELLKFLYTGKAELVDGMAEDLLPVADKYGLDVLKQIAVRYLCNKVNKDTVALLLSLADRHSVAQLKTLCLAFVRANPLEVMLTDGFPLVHKLVKEEMEPEVAIVEEEDEEGEQGEEGTEKEENTRKRKSRGRPPLHKKPKA